MVGALHLPLFELFSNFLLLLMSAFEFVFSLHAYNIIFIISIKNILKKIRFEYNYLRNYFIFHLLSYQ